MSCHAGNGVFLNTSTGQYIIYQGKRLFQVSSLYVNKLGLGVIDAVNKFIDHKQFQLDTDRLKKIKEEYLECGFHGTIVNLNISENALFNHSIF